MWQSESEESHLHENQKQLEALTVQILCVGWKRTKNKHNSTSISKLKGGTHYLLSPVQKSGGLGCSLRIRPLASIPFQLVGRDCELEQPPGWPILNCEAIPAKDTVSATAVATSGAWTSLFSPTALHCWTHKHRNIYCTWNVIWCLSVLASDGLEGKREGRLREWMSEEISCKHEGWAGVWIQWLHPIELHSNTKLVATAPPGGPHVKHRHGTFYRCPG